MQLIDGVLDGPITDAWTWVGALPDWQAFAVVVGLSIVLAALVHVGGDVLIRRLTRAIPTDVDDVVLGTLHPAIWLTVITGGTFLGVAQLDLLDGDLASFQAATFTLLTIIWAVTLSRLGRRVTNTMTDDGYVDRQIVPIVQNVWSVLVVTLTVFLLLSFWRVDVTPLLASAGVIGIVVGLAARDTIANFFGSLALYADGTYKVGDYVVLENGERGRVQDISVRSTVIRTRDDVLVTVPNSRLSNASIVNESTPRQHRRIKIPVGVAYGTDVDQVEELMLAVADGEDLVREHPSPRVRLREFGDSALQVEMMCWISRPRLVGRATDNLLREIYVGFRDAGIEIPFPQRDVTVSTASLDGSPDASPDTSPDTSPDPPSDASPESPVDALERTARTTGADGD